MINKYTILICLIVTHVVYCTGCRQEKDSDTTAVREIIRIGVVAPFEGSNAHIGKMIMRSVTLYFDQQEYPGLDVRVVPIDTRSSPTDASIAIQSAVADPDMVALIAFYHSSTALACKTIINESRIPTIIYSASNPTVTDEAPYYFRLVPRDDSQSQVLAGFAKDLNASSITILYYADEYGKGLADGIREEAGQLGLSVADVESYDATTTDFRPVLTVLKESEPDVIMICGFVEKSIAILNQAAERGVQATFLAGDGTFNEEQLIAGAGPNAEGVYVAAPYVFDDGNIDNQAFLKAYADASSSQGADGEHNPASWAAFAYDAAGIFGQAIIANRRDRESIVAFLKAMNSEERAYKGIVGPIYFDDRGDAVGRTFQLAVVRNGRFVPAKQPE